MLKIATTALVIFALLTVTTHGPALAQSQPKTGDETVSSTVKKEKPGLPFNVAETPKEKKRPDFKKIFDEETKQFKKKSAEFDPVKLDLERTRQQAPKHGLTGKEKTFLIVFIVGIAVLVVLLAKYGKNCIETTPKNCNIGTDENCYCERYEEDDDAKR